MWTRAELKSNAKVTLKKNYFKTLFVGLVLSFILGSGAANAGRDAKNTAENAGVSISKINPAILLGVAAIVLGAILMGVVISILLSIFLWNPLQVGCFSYMVEAHEEDNPEVIENLTFAFKNGYGNIGKIMFLRGLFNFLWYLLFIIPGIVKSYEYAMIPYLLAEDPEMSQEEAFAKSKEMMKGQKWNAFVLDLSFIGWEILGAITFGVLTLLYVRPYEYLTHADLYRTLRDAQDAQ